MHACRGQVALPSPPFHSSPSLPVPMSWSSMARICAWADMFVRVGAANAAGVPAHAASASAGLAVAATLSPREANARARPQLRLSHGDAWKTLNVNLWALKPRWNERGGSSRLLPGSGASSCRVAVSKGGDGGDSGRGVPGETPDRRRQLLPRRHAALSHLVNSREVAKFDCVLDFYFPSVRVTALRAPSLLRGSAVIWGSRSPAASWGALHLCRCEVLRCNGSCWHPGCKHAGRDAATFMGLFPFFWGLLAAVNMEHRPQRFKCRKIRVKM